MSAYDALAPNFDRDRALPEGVAEAIRAAVIEAAGVARPRVLDLGAGTGRIGWPFVASGDDYVGADLSFGMLRAFMARAGADRRIPRLVQADGHRLPFPAATFDAVMLIQVFGGMSDWQQFVGEARRVLRSSGVAMIGRTVAPDDGLDARMKRELASILAGIGAQARGKNKREDVQSLLAANARETRTLVASWTAERTPRQFIDRHRSGARFAALPDAAKDDALRGLGAWAAASFGSLDTVSSEPYGFELRVFKFEGVHV
jgi:ubiquinone/menaquinone biosynthesis C-methylase UbiE